VGDDVFGFIESQSDDAPAVPRYAPEKWSVRQVLNHVTDTERVRFSVAVVCARVGDADAVSWAAHVESSTPVLLYSKIMVHEVQTVRVSSKGQIAIPKEIRDRLGLSRGTDMVVRIQGDSVVLRKAPKDSWRKWAGRFAGSGLTEELAASRREEIVRDSQSS
jgi:AbrB family looped-hinge helix DNA binding protein